MDYRERPYKDYVEDRSGVVNAPTRAEYAFPLPKNTGGISFSVVCQI